MLEDTWRWQQLNPKGYEEPILLVMAAGMGSRYGGLKQMDPVGPGGEFILDYSIYDALRAGFKKVVFIISAAMEEDFKEIVGNRWEDQLQLEYVIQEIHHVPEGATYRTDRKKPWGTGHAVLEAKDVIDGPFAVINADDFYGPDTFKKLYQFMATQSRDNTYGMVAFHLGQTVTEHGHVSRGICTLDEEGYLASVVERTEIYKDKDAIYYKDGEDKVMLHEETLVSMNTWTLTPSFMEALEKGFVRFLEAHGQEEKSEYFLPFVVDDLIQQGKVQVKVMETKEKWYGVTYHEDKDKVIQGIGKLIEEGIYPETLK